jgi:putative component of membrane protein insertase Oxa1/YidC/SpoIIIJ protein YidD
MTCVSWLLIRAIHIYRQLMSETKRRHCLFRQSCSHHVEFVARDKGTWAALGALRARVRACRPGYAFVVDAASHSWVMVCRDGSKHRPETLAESARQEGEALVAVVATQRTRVAVNISVPDGG